MSLSVKTVGSFNEAMYAKKLYEEIEAHLVCIITQEAMIDPVVTDGGFSYEKKAIIEWRNTKGTCPITKKWIDQLVPNKALKSIAIELAERKKSNDFTLTPFKAFYCIFGKSIMKTPVITWLGDTFEKSQNPYIDTTYPMNLSVKKCIESWVKFKTAYDLDLYKQSDEGRAIDLLGNMLCRRTIDSESCAALKSILPKLTNFEITEVVKKALKASKANVGSEQAREIINGSSFLSKNIKNRIDFALKDIGDQAKNKLIEELEEKNKKLAKEYQKLEQTYNWAVKEQSRFNQDVKTTIHHLKESERKKGEAQIQFAWGAGETLLGLALLSAGTVGGVAAGIGLSIYGVYKGYHAMNEMNQADKKINHYSQQLLTV